MLPEYAGGLLSWICSNKFGTRHATLLDPADQSAEDAAAKALAAVEGGSKLILVGGSTNTPENKVHDTVVGIQEALELRVWAASQDSTVNEEDWRIPVILFPGGAHALSSSADAILFMMLMNSTIPRFLVEEQVKGATWLHEAGIEMLPTAYLICEPGGKAGEVGQANLLNSPKDIRAYSLCAKGYGMKILYLEAGSGAPSPLDSEMIKSAEGECLFVGGGIRTTEHAISAKEAGASWIVTGTIVEEQEDLDLIRLKIEQLVSALN